MTKRSLLAMFAAIPIFASDSAGASQTVGAFDLGIPTKIEQSRFEFLAIRAPRGTVFKKCTFERCSLLAMPNVQCERCMFIDCEFQEPLKNYDVSSSVVK